MNAAQKSALKRLQNLERSGGTLEEQRFVIGIGYANGLCDVNGTLTPFAQGYLEPQTELKPTEAEIKLAVASEGLIDIVNGKHDFTRLRARAAALKQGLINHDGTPTDKGTRISMLQGMLSKWAA